MDKNNINKKQLVGKVVSDSMDKTVIIESSRVDSLSSLPKKVIAIGRGSAKPVVSTIMYSFISVGVVSVVWVLWGYSLAFGGGGSAYIGTLNNFALSGVDTPDAKIFEVFQMMF